MALAAIVLLAIFGVSAPYSALIFAVFWAIGTDEWARLMRFRPLGRGIYVAVFVGFVAVVVGIGIPAALTRLILWLAAAAWVVMFWLVLKSPRPLWRPPMVAVGSLVIGAAWLAFDSVHRSGADGPALILTGLVIVWCADIGAFFVGRSVGRTPLAPRVSPKKTWEGVGGGIALATLAGSVAAPVMGLPLGLLAPVAAAMALISVVGDLSISLLKRQAGLKDSGMLLPGHGGILDRFDGVTAALPFFVLGLQFAHVLD